MSKHSTKFNFDQFTAFVDTMTGSLKSEKQWTLDNLEEFLVRVKLFAKRQFKVKDTLLFWVAHAKLQRRLRKKLKELTSCMKKPVKDIKTRRQKLKQHVDEEYYGRKVKYEQLPKYIKATRIDLYKTAFINLVQNKSTITVKERDEIISSQLDHKDKCEQLVQLKKQLD